MNHLKVMTATFGLSAALVTTTLCSHSKAEVNNGTPEKLAVMTFQQWDNVKAGCVIEGTEVDSRFGATGRWERKAQLWDKDCVKRKMKEKGYANAVVFDPDKMSDFKKEICDLYDLSVVTVDGVVLENRFGTAFKQCQ